MSGKTDSGLVSSWSVSFTEIDEQVLSRRGKWPKQVFLGSLGPVGRTNWGGKVEVGARGPDRRDCTVLAGG